MSSSSRENWLVLLTKCSISSFDNPWTKSPCSLESCTLVLWTKKLTMFFMDSFSQTLLAEFSWKIIRIFILFEILGFRGKFRRKLLRFAFFLDLV
jgi:hypothetical protein